MACDRCGAHIARDGCLVHAALSTPNGRRLYLEVGIKAHADQAGHRAVFFCEACFMALLQLFGQIGEANRVTLQ